MKTRFTIKSYLISILTFASLYLLFILVPIFFGSPYYEDKLFPKIFVPGIMLFTSIGLIFGELRTKNIYVELNNNEIIVKRFFSLMTERYRVSEIDGWKYSFLPSRFGTYEYLYLYKNNKKQIKISEFYHKNYKEFKKEIQSNFKSLGYEKFSYIDELKEIFT